MLYLMWHDDSKKPTLDKIAAACDRYQERFGKRATIVLCNPQDITACAFVEVLPDSARGLAIHRNIFYVGAS